jgi:hypothetical protein
MSPLLGLTQDLTRSQLNGLIAAAVVVVVGLFIYGIKDVFRLSLIRIWAISGVVFRESIRRKVLLIAPIVMLGVIIVSQLQRSVDEQDAIRQIIKYCLFASGFFVVLAGIILSCTNLPRDIESKVVFTIVTKPTTRLELVIGKIVGFARVSAAILLIMGLFSYIYLLVVAGNLSRSVQSKLQSPVLDEFQRNLLTHYREEGLLRARHVENSDRMMSVSRYTGDEEPFIVADSNQVIRVPFSTKPIDFVPGGLPEDAPPGIAEGKLEIVLGFERNEHHQSDQPLIFNDDTGNKPTVSVSIVSRDEYDLIPAGNLPSGGTLVVEQGKPIALTLSREQIGALANAGEFYVSVNPVNPSYRIRVGDEVARIKMGGTGIDNQKVISASPDFTNPGQKVAVRGRDGRFGQLVSGVTNTNPTPALAVYRFVDAPQAQELNGKVSVQMRVGIEQNSDEDKTMTRIDVRAIDRKTKKESNATVAIESNRNFFVDLDAEPFRGGNYDVIVSAANRDLVIGLGDRSVGVVHSRYAFALNLAKALLCQWMLAVLVVTIGLFCSTFVSWPIAIVLSLVLLLGRWLVEQVRDSLQSGAGAGFANDIGAATAAGARVISGTYDLLAATLRNVADFLPNIDRFATASLVERGNLLPWSSVGGAAMVMLVFGLPLLTLAYVFLRNKEVAP